MKRSILLFSIVAVGALGYWVVSGGIGRVLEQNFKRRSAETGELKIAIHEQFHGSWKLVGQIKSDGTRETVVKSHVLELSGDSMRRRPLDGSASSSPQESIYISDGGQLWIGGDSAFDDSHIADLRVDGSEMHLIDVFGNYHLIYERVENADDQTPDVGG